MSRADHIVKRKQMRKEVLRIAKQDGMKLTEVIKECVEARVKPTTRNIYGILKGLKQE